MIKNRFSEWLNKVSSGWVTLSAVIIFIMFTALVLPGQSARSEEAGGERSPDLSLYYSADDLYRMTEEYGEAGREAYIRARFTFDIAWPLVYTFFFVTTISWIYSRTFPAESRWRRSNLVPVLAMVFDLLENISTSLVMYRYPERMPVVDSLAGVFTTLKWVFVAGSFVLLIVGLVIGVLSWYKRRRLAGGYPDS